MIGCAMMVDAFVVALVDCDVYNSFDCFCVLLMRLDYLLFIVWCGLVFVFSWLLTIFCLFACFVGWMLVFVLNGFCFRFRWFVFGLLDLGLTVLFDCLIGFCVGL